MTTIAAPTTKQARPTGVANRARGPRRHDDRVLRLLYFWHRSHLFSGRCSSRRPRPKLQMLNAYPDVGSSSLPAPSARSCSAILATASAQIDARPHHADDGGLRRRDGVDAVYEKRGVLRRQLLAALRFLQGVGLGGEWGGAALIAVENAPEGKTCAVRHVPELGPPIGFLIATGLFLSAPHLPSRGRLLSRGLGVAPFLPSAVLVAIGLCVRVSLEETPAFLEALEQKASAPTSPASNYPFATIGPR